MGRGVEDVVFYRVLLPVLAACNLALGVLTLGGLGRPGWIGAIELATGAVCCAIGGGLVAAALSKSYWSRAMRRQVGVWRQVSDALVGWLDETRTSEESLARLHASLRDILVPDKPSTSDAQPAAAPGDIPPSPLRGGTPASGRKGPFSSAGVG